MTEIPRAESLERAVTVARLIWRRVGPAGHGEAAIGMTRSERSDVLDTAELVLRVGGGRRYLVEVRELGD